MTYKASQFLFHVGQILLDTC